MILVLAMLAVGCEGDLDPAWQLDHDRIVAVRATPPAIVPGEQAVLDALVSFDGGDTSELSPELAVATSPMSLADVLVNDAGMWIVRAPPEAMLAVARMELQLPAGAEVPLQVSVRYGSLEATKIIRLGATHANPRDTGTEPDTGCPDERRPAVSSALAVRRRTRDAWRVRCNTGVHACSPTRVVSRRVDPRARSRAARRPRCAAARANDDEHRARWDGGNEANRARSRRHAPEGRAGAVDVARRIRNRVAPR